MHVLSLRQFSYCVQVTF